MAKPEHQWQTRRRLAVREPWPEGVDSAGPRAEAFALRPLQAQGDPGWARLGLTAQVVDAASAADPDLPHAVACWLVARGARALALRDDSGRVLAQGPIDVASLGAVPPDEDQGRAVRRLVTLAPSNAEVVEALGRWDDVVGCEDSTDLEGGDPQRRRLGPDLGPDLDAVTQLRPDLVVASLTVPGMERVVTGLRARGLPFVVLAPRRLADVMDDVQTVAAALGDPDRGAAVVGRMREEIAALEADRPARRARVYLEWWPKPMFTPGADCYSRDVIALAGGTNVFGEREGSSLQIEPGELLQADPDVCFVSWCGVPEAKLDPDNLVSRAGLEELRAAKAGQVYAIDERFTGRPGPRLIEAARRMAEKIRALAD